MFHRKLLQYFIASELSEVRRRLLVSKQVEDGCLLGSSASGHRPDDGGSTDL
jgi:hypothetical protein